jgi:hypothetical protein
MARITASVYTSHVPARDALRSPTPKPGAVEKDW